MDYGSIVPLQRANELVDAKLFVITESVDKSFDPIQEFFDLVKAGEFAFDLFKAEAAVDPRGDTKPSWGPGPAKGLDHPKYEMAASRALMQHYGKQAVSFKGRASRSTELETQKKYARAADRLDQLEAKHGQIDDADAHEHLMKLAHSASMAPSRGEEAPDHPEHVHQGETHSVRAKAHADYLRSSGEGHRTGEKKEIKPFRPPGESRLFKIEGKGPGKATLTPTPELGKLKRTSSFRDIQSRGAIMEGAGVRGRTASPSDFPPTPTPSRAAGERLPSAGEPVGPRELTGVGKFKRSLELMNQLLSFQKSLSILDEMQSMF
jgi:hypothetical protein